MVAEEVAVLEPEDLPLLAQAYRISQCLYVVASLGVADHLLDGPKNAVDLAKACGCHSDRLRRVLRALAAEQVFSEDDQGRFGLTSYSEQLVGDSEARLMMVGWRVLPASYMAFSGLLHAVRTGESAFEHVHGSGFYDYLAAHPSAARDYDAATGSTVEAFEELAELLDLGGAQTVVDVGGGRGGLVACLLSRNSQLRAILFEQPEVVAGAGELLAAHGVADRVTVVGGDVFESVPAGGDVYVTCTVLRCFDDDSCLRILANIRAAMPAHARLMAMEQCIPPGPAQAPTAALDLHTMVVYGGRDRTEAQYRDLYARAGLRLTEALPAGGPFAVFVGHLDQSQG
jgi:hypothetical protein